MDFEILEESALAMAQSTIQNAINAANSSRADLARRMQCNRSVISRILSGNNLTIKTMARALAACGVEIRFVTVPLEVPNEPPSNWCRHCRKHTVHENRICQLCLKTNQQEVE
jgi:transcriptional regulator with XRE-family HTH domain